MKNFFLLRHVKDQKSELKKCHSLPFYLNCVLQVGYTGFLGFPHHSAINMFQTVLFQLGTRFGHINVILLQFLDSKSCWYSVYVQVLLEQGLEKPTDGPCTTVVSLCNATLESLPV